MTEIKVKMVVTGDPGVGKTSILQRYNNRQFIPNYSATIGVDFAKVDVNYNNTQFNMYIWDTAGQDKFKFMTHSFYTKITAALVVYDITSHSSLLNVMNWVDDIREKTPECYMFIVGNKIDLENHRQVTPEKINSVLKTLNIPPDQYIECSCKDDINVNTIFNTVVEKLFKDIEDGKLKNEEIHGVKVYKNKRLIQVKNRAHRCCSIL